MGNIKNNTHIIMKLRTSYIYKQANLPASTNPKKEDLKYLFTLAINIVGIYLGFGLGAILKEDSIKNVKIFIFSQTFLMCFLTFSIARIGKLIIGEKSSNTIPTEKKLRIGFFLSVSQIFGMQGYKMASFFVGNIVKSSKCISIILFALFTRDWKYLKTLTRTTFITVFMLTVGILGFILNNNNKTSSFTSYSILGIFL